MCGRFVQKQNPDAYADFFGAGSVLTESLGPNFNVAPTDPVYAVAEHDGERSLGAFRWGLIPWFAKDVKAAARNINARAESVATKASFKRSFERRRCIIPADGFYEWQPLPKGKLPHYIYRADGEPMALAGIWASWRHPETDERIRTCSIITGPPNDLVKPIHDRMPVVLQRGSWSMWLDPETDDMAGLQALLTPIDAALTAEHPVSTLVNKVANNVPELIDPLETPAVDQTLFD